MSEPVYGGPDMQAYTAQREREFAERKAKENRIETKSIVDAIESLGQEKGRDWSKGLVEEIERVHGAVTGTGDPMSDDELRSAVDWIERQAESEWEVRPFSEYDNAVRALGRACVKEARVEIARIAELRIR